MQVDEKILQTVCEILRPLVTEGQEVIIGSTSDPVFGKLVAFGLGKLEPADAEKIAEHLDSCEDCSETVINLQDDTFVSLVRNSPAPTPHEDDSLAPQMTVDVASGRAEG